MDEKKVLSGKPLLEELLPFLRPKPGVAPAAAGCRPAEPDGCDAYRVRAAAYKKIIEKYADYIGLQEEKTIPALKELVNGEDAAIRQLAADLKEELERGLAERAGVEADKSELQYNFRRDFLGLAEKAFDLVQALSPINADLSVSYWLSPRDVVDLKAADPFDKAIFLCSLLHALGEKTAKIRVVELEGGARHPLVLFEHAGKRFVLDPSDADCRFNASWTEGTHEELVRAALCGGKKVTRPLYEFNDENYQQFTE